MYIIGRMKGYSITLTDVKDFPDGSLIQIGDDLIWLGQKTEDTFDDCLMVDLKEHSHA